MSWGAEKLAISQAVIDHLGEPVRIITAAGAVTVRAHWLTDIDKLRGTDASRLDAAMEVMLADVQGVSLDSGSTVDRCQERFVIVSRQPPKNGKQRIHLRRSA